MPYFIAKGDRRKTIKIINVWCALCAPVPGIANGIVM